MGLRGLLIFFTSTSSVGVNPFIEPAEMNITPKGHEEPIFVANGDVCVTCKTIVSIVNQTPFYLIKYNQI
jgi:hypothetical protein